MDACLNGWINGIYLDNVMIWKCFLHYWPFVTGNHRSFCFEDVPTDSNTMYKGIYNWFMNRIYLRYSNSLFKVGHWNYWGRVTHICVSKLTNIGSDNGLSPGPRHAIIWSSTVISSIGPMETKHQWNHNRNLYIFIQYYAFGNIVCKMASILFRPHSWVTSV